jgi:two-component sensor histidine kinase
MRFGFGESVWRWLERRARKLPPGPDEPSGWRQLVFNGVFFTLVILGGISYLPTFLGAVQRGMWGTAVLYSSIYLFGLSVLLLRKLEFRKRAAIGVLGLYLIGLCTLEIAGLSGSGRIWLFCFPLLACLFLGLRWALVALGLNIVTMAFFIAWGEAWTSDWTQLFAGLSHKEIWVITSGTFVLLNAAAIVSLAFIIRGLEASLGSSRRLQSQLEEEQKRLETVNENLSHEIKERRRAEAQLSVALGDRERMLQEMHHRVNGHMQVVSSLLSLSRAKISDYKARELVQESQHRVRAVGLIHESIYRTGSLAEVGMAAYIEDLARNLLQVYDLESRQVELSIDADETTLGLDEAVPCGLVLNELMINTLKHAYTLGSGGELLIKVRQGSNNFIELTVADKGIGLPPGFKIGEGTGMGLYLAKSLVENQLHGTFKVISDPGVKVLISFHHNGVTQKAKQDSAKKLSDTAA